MKCPNCGKTDFEPMRIIDDQCTEGHVYQLVKAYTCINCGRTELYMPQEYIAKVLKRKQEEIERKQIEEARKQEKIQLEARMRELEIILQDENRTMKELKEAQKELTAIQDKLNIRIRKVYIKI